MSHSLLRNDFDGPEALADGLVTAVASALRAGIETRGRASLVVSGGSTPALFLNRLGREELEWARVSVTLVDERWVPETSERSNAKMLRETLLSGNASAANFRPLFTDKKSPENGLVLAARHVASLARPFDAVVLGMGADGHTASFFPGGDKLAEALDLDSSALILAMRAPGAGEPRVTLTLPVLLGTGFLALHIEGAQKADVLEEALGEGDVAAMPVRAVLRQTRVPVNIFWCP